ncbi:MAG: DUF494 family protein [Melioribacteraceae bacterium]|jgi:uncharacterized protein Smg (DUF494 family)|nr:DUF494 family protein [Melioribacteraceae bacterium]
MNTKLVEILTKILEGLSNNKSIEEINKKLLLNNKVDEHTLSVAFSIIYDKILIKKKPSSEEKDKSKGIRLLTDHEKDLLGIDNYNYLLHLINLRLLDSTNFEAILDQVTIFPDMKLTRREINWIVLLSLVEFESGVLPGSRVLLASSDIVN